VDGHLTRNSVAREEVDSQPDVATDTIDATQEIE